MSKQVTDEDLELLEQLEVDSTPTSTGGRSAREQRIIAGFEEIERFVAEHGRLPEHDEHRDIFERLYAVRLDCLRKSQECRDVLQGMDSRGLLGEAMPIVEKEATDDELLAALGVQSETENDVTHLVHVRSRDEIKAAEEIAQRAPCLDFDVFKPEFEKVQADLESGVRKAVKYKDDAGVKQGDFFILDGQKAFVAALGDQFTSEYGRPDRRLRVIYDNGTESDLLLRSLQRALNKDKTSRRITYPDAGPLFSGIAEEGDQATGYIYVLQSRSDHPFLKEHRNVVHKIGLTKSEVKRRVSNAKKETTYLLSDVEEVASIKLANIKPKALEAVLHKFFGSAKLDMELIDRFGIPVEPQEWFLVPLPAITEAIDRIIDGSISDYKYDATTARLVPLDK